MYLCNASAPSPWSDMADARAAEGVPVDAEFPPHLHDRLVCELSRHHSGKHASFLCELSRNSHLWVRWEGEEFTCVILRPCALSDATADPIRQEACTLFAGHSPGHSWQFADMLQD
ncbi:hypothetical protein ABTZ78_23715 [Streptomyces bauhiniae]|uniref:hypothetical protein n=1 Tax=Streptomyces bauhiniae TaxID=2340725 RepID=UPI0033217FC2